MDIVIVSMIFMAFHGLSWLFMAFPHEGIIIIMGAFPHFKYDPTISNGVKIPNTNYHTFFLDIRKTLTFALS